MSMKLALSLAAFATVFANGKVYAPEPKYKKAHAARVGVPPIPVCKDGSVYDPAAGCSYVDYAEPKLDCPHPYKRDKHTGQCVARTYGESMIICPKGSYLHGKKCISEVTAPVEYTCKHHDAILTDQGCLVHAEPTKVADDFKPVKLSCPHKFKLEKDICVAEHHVHADLICEKGWELHGKKCITIDLQPPICPKGYMFQMGECVAETIVQPEPYCPKHTDMIKGQCMQKISQHPIPVCEKGYEMGKKGKCEARVLLQAIMPDAKKGMDFAVDCKHGHLDDKGNCYQIHTSHAVPVCDAGFELHHKKCIAHVPVDIEFACPKHFDQTKDGMCIRRHAKKVKCPHRYKFDDKQGMCVGKIKEKAARVCPKGSSSQLKGGHHDKCIEIEYAEPLASCHKHYDLVGDVCVKPGMVKAGKDKIHPPKAFCPKGFKRDKHKSICISLLEAHAEPVCEKGYVLEKKKCVAYHTTPPQAMCPKGFVNEGKGCMRISYTRPVFECPKGAHEHGHQCYIYQDQDIMLGPEPPMKDVKDVKGGF